MTGINTITKLFIIIAVIVISVISPCYPAISDRRLCFDPQCSVPVSTATTMISYPSNDPGILSFKSNTEVRVFSKGAGKRKDLWGVEINGQRGYVPSNLLKEKRIMHRNLQHEVPTELIATKAQDKDSKNGEAEELLKTVPNVPADFAAAQENVAQGLEEANAIVKEEPTKSVPVLDQVSPSYEIHDGTTIPFAGNDEPSEPSYSTQVPQGIVEMGDQPILSIHPNIASTVTRKTHADSLPVAEAVDDAEKYFEATGLKEESPSGKIVAEEIAATATETAQTNLDDDSEATKEAEDGVPLTGIEGVKIAAETTTQAAQVSDSQENVQKTIESSDDADDSEDDEDEEGEDSEEENDTRDSEATAAAAPAAAEKVETDTEKPTIEKQEVDENNNNNTGAEQPAKEKGVETSPVESKTEAATPEVLETITSSEEQVSVNNESEISVQDNNLETVGQDSGAANQSNVTEEIPAVDKIEENATSAEVEIKEEPVNADSNDAAQEPAQEAQEFAAELKEIKPEQPAEAKEPEEALPNNLHIMNPLFNRLAKIPAMVKEVVDNAISGGGAADENPTKTEEIVDAAAPEVITSSNMIPDAEQTASVPPVDFSTDISSSSNDYQNDTEDSIPVTKASEENSPSYPEAVKIDADDDKSVNIYNDTSLENENSNNYSTADSVATQTSQEFTTESPVQPGISKEDELTGFRRENFAMDDTSSFNGFPGNRNLLNVGSTLQPERTEESSGETATTVITPLTEPSINSATEKTPEVGDEQNGIEATTESASSEYVTENSAEVEGKSVVEETTRNEGDEENHGFLHAEEKSNEEDFAGSIRIGRNFWETFSYVVLTAFTTLLFSLGYYYIENTRRDGQLIAKINKLEKELLVSSKECTVLDDNLKSVKTKLDSIEDESFGSNEMVVSLKADLEASKTAKSELEDQVAMLEKELESATEAGLELERMLREILSTKNEDNPLAQSVEDLQTRLNAQQAANEALTNALNLKAQENENLTSDLAAMTLKCEQLEVELTRITEEMKHQNNVKNNMEQTMLDKLGLLEKQVQDISAERINLRTQLKGKEMELKDLLEVVNQMNINNLDFEKLYNVSKVKAEASQLLEERDDLKVRLSEVEGAHQLLEEHVKLINEEVSLLSEQCKSAEKAKRDAETRVEVLSNFFKEKEAQRQKEEAVWLEKQGEVSSTVERLHTMQNEIHNYKQQIEMLKREILDQEREYKNQIAGLETKSHEQWVIARQHERRLEESKAEAGQLRNRLTLIEKNLNDDPEAKLHRLEANGETATSPQLFIGAEASSSPIMFTGSSGVPLPPPPSYLYGPPVPPFMPPPPHSSSGIPPYEVGQRPPPLGGRLSSPPPLHGSGSSRYDNPRSPPPPLSPSMLPPYGPPHRAYPSPFPNDRIHPPPPPPHSSMLPPPLGPPSHNWGDDTLPPLRNSGFQPHLQQHHRDQQRARNHKGSLHSSGESLDKNV